MPAPTKASRGTCRMASSTIASGAQPEAGLRRSTRSPVRNRCGIWAPLDVGIAVAGATRTKRYRGSYCSDRCQYLANAPARAMRRAAFVKERCEDRADRRTDRDCAYCGDPLLGARRSTMRYCGNACRQAAHRQRDRSLSTAVKLRTPSAINGLAQLCQLLMVNRQRRAGSIPTRTLRVRFSI